MAGEEKIAGVIDLKMSPSAYARALILLLESGDARAKKLARQEIKKFVKAVATLNPDAWAKEE